MIRALYRFCKYKMPSTAAFQPCGTRFFSMATTTMTRRGICFLLADFLLSVRRTSLTHIKNRFRSLCILLIFFACAVLSCSCCSCGRGLCPILTSKGSPIDEPLVLSQSKTSVHFWSREASVTAWTADAFLDTISRGAS